MSVDISSQLAACGCINFQKHVHNSLKSVEQASHIVFLPSLIHCLRITFKSAWTARRKWGGALSGVKCLQIHFLQSWGVTVNVPSDTWWHKVVPESLFSTLSAHRLQKALLVSGVQVAKWCFICPYMLIQEIHCFPYRRLCFFATENGGMKCSITSAFSKKSLAKNFFWLKL